MRPSHAEGKDSRDNNEGHVMQRLCAGCQPTLVKYEPGERTEKTQSQNKPQQAERLQGCMQKKEPADHQNHASEDQSSCHVRLGAHKPMCEGPAGRVPSGKDQNQCRQKAYQYSEHDLNPDIVATAAMAATVENAFIDYSLIVFMDKRIGSNKAE